MLAGKLTPLSRLEHTTVRSAYGASFCPIAQVTSIAFETTNEGVMRTSDHPRMELSALADLCLGQLAEDPAQLAEFMGFAGYDPTALRRAVGTRQLATGLVDYFAANEPLMLSLCANNGLKPDEFMRVWHRLNPGG
jgi:hypothetical protein